MKKKIMYSLVLMLLSSTIAIAASIHQTKNNTIKIGANDMKFMNDIFNINDMIYVPIRELSEKMGIPIVWNQSSNQVELLTNFKTVSVEGQLKSDDTSVIPDEETAYNVGKIILEKYMGKSLEYETDTGIYYLAVKYHPLDNSWRISQECRYKAGGGGGTGIYSPTIVLNKNTGEVIYIYTDTVFEN